MVSSKASDHPLQDNTLISIYAAAVSPTGWNDVVDQCAIEAGACGGAMLSYDALDRESYSVSGMGERIREVTLQDPKCLQEYFAEIVPLELAIHQHMHKHPARRIWHENEIWPKGMEKESRKHYDWLLRWFGTGPKLIARLNDHPRIKDSFVLHFPENHVVTNSSINAFQRQLPHLAKSAEMGVLYNALYQRYSAVLAVLDKVDVGICVLDGSGRVYCEQ